MRYTDSKPFEILEFSTVLACINLLYFLFKKIGQSLYKNFRNFNLYLAFTVFTLFYIGRLCLPISNPTELSAFTHSLTISLYVEGLL